MKRKNYSITINGVPVPTKAHAWNTARDLVRRLIKENMAGDTNAWLEESAYLKDGPYHVSGIETWKTSDGREFIATINKEPPL